MCGAESPAMQHGTPEALLAAISQSTNELTQGWMRVLGAAPWLPGNAALQSSYLEKQSELWQAMRRSLPRWHRSS